MSERLDRIEAQQERNSADIADLIALSENLLRAVEEGIRENHRRDEENRRRDEENRARDERFEILRQEAIADRKAADAKFNALLLEIQSTNRRVDALEQRNPDQT